ncbi:MBL fold metallo-hydrolase [Flavobacteriaceae bacterium M23B6Z8]
MKNFVFFFFLVLLLPNRESSSEVTFTYIGNMGVLIQQHEKSILIDGLHEYYGDEYSYPNANLLQKINEQYQPHTLLFTHSHGDHFSVGQANTYLKDHENTLVSGPAQVTDMLDVPNAVKITIATDNYQKQRFKRPGFLITAFRMDHAGGRHTKRQNIAFIINTGDIKILHVGDSNWRVQKDLFETNAIKKEAIDVAILPHWMLADQTAKDFIQNYLPDTQLIATHISPKVQDDLLRSLQEKFPKLIIFNQLEQQTKLSKQKE